VRELQLRLTMRVRLRTPGGKELMPPTQIEQTRDITYNETAALAKESETELLYRDMQTDIAQQTLRRLAAVKSL
jgi:LPS-assembly lipoprotein